MNERNDNPTETQADKQAGEPTDEPTGKKTTGKKAKAKGKATAIEIGKEALAPLLAAEPKLAERFGAVIEQRSSELASRNKEARHWVSVGVGREQIAARMTSFYSG